MTGSEYMREFIHEFINCRKWRITTMNELAATIALSSVTWAMKAQDALKDAGIYARVKRLGPGEAPRGCAWGIELPRAAQASAHTMLGRLGIPHELL